MTQQPSVPGASPIPPAPTSGLRAFRRIAIIVIIVSLSLTALIGIVTLVTGSLGDVQGKIMLTTLIIGASSVVALCDLAVLGRRVRAVGIAGLIAAVLSLITALLLVWGDSSSELVVKTFALAGIAAVSIAHASLLLLLSERRRPAVRIGLWITVALIALLLALLYVAILSDGEVWSGGYTKLVGTVAILDVLGTIVVPVVSLFLRDNAAGASLTVTVPPALAARLGGAAQASGMSPEQFAIEAITRRFEAPDSVESSPTQ
ncbi:hypothetical protein [Parafrigoribacterium humi]|uniref:hypothetical protein n=1 Tax=Parafrigoribacterium humi TaxID=3144664 RepID=UPI0032EE170E